MKNDATYLRFILAMIERIDNAIVSGEEAFLKSHLHQDAVLRNLQTITETTQRLTTGLKQANPDVEWKTLSAFRNILVHDYLGIDVELVWTVVTTDIPVFKQRISEILSGLE